ncbi:MAG: hypothetical protein JOZ22_07505 [Acidobacteriia bacterium]|nr:hypothetical protein [Terriglobia bacterium]
MAANGLKLPNKNRAEWLLALVALLTALAVQPGEVGSVDTERRLQTTHSFWTSAPPVVPEDYPAFGIMGRNHKIYAWYGIGQSLVMLPPDILATLLLRVLPRSMDQNEFRGLVVSFAISPIVCVLSVLLTFRFLMLLGFSLAQGMAGALGLLFGTTFLHYTQNMMENNLILLLTLAGLYLHYEWLRSGNPSKAWWGSALLGANLLIRVTTGLNLAAVALFIVWSLVASGWRQAGHRLVFYAKTLAASSLVFLAGDRAYHYYRFGECCSNYIELYGRQQKLLDPSLPAAFPYTTPFWEGFWRPLVSLEKSVFLFDPLLLLSLLLAFTLWRRLAPEVRAYLVSCAVLLIAEIAVHARLWFWSGDVAWGDRYLSAPVQLAGLIAVPLLMRHRLEIGTALQFIAKPLLAGAVLIQLASVALWYPLEFDQMKTISKPVFVVGLRFWNILAMCSGKMYEWRLTNSWTDAAVRARTAYLWPFLLPQRHDFLPHWAVEAGVAVWLSLVIAILLTLCLICRSVRTSQPALQPVASNPDSQLSLSSRRFS